MKSLQQQIKNVAKNIEKELNKELAKKRITVPYECKGSAQMISVILDNESEEVLKNL